MNDSKNSNTHGFIYRFFSSIWGFISWVRVAIFNVVFIIFIVCIVMAVKQQTPDVLPNSFALELSPSGILVEELSAINPTQALLEDESSKQYETVVSDIIRTIDYAATDKKVSTLILKLNDMRGGGMGHLQEIGKALSRFKDSGKKIIALSNNYSQGQYFLASHADKIVLHNMGSVSLTGFSSYRLYYKEALDKLNVSVNIFRAGKYKDAIEPYLRNNMSEASRAQNGLWINGLWKAYTAHIETMRNLPNGAVNHLANNIDTLLESAKGNHAQLALQQQLVDVVATQQEIQRELIAEFGEKLKTQTYNAVNWQRYLATKKPAVRAASVGLIIANGQILDGFQLEGAIGGESMSQLLRKVRKNSNIKALVIRVNSGGGSAIASEFIRAEVQAIRDAGIPVVISMGNVAASGGYWIATAADEIWALPTTITGSIGVFGISPNLHQTLAKVGVHVDGLGSTEIATAGFLGEPNAKINAAAQLSVNAIYLQFLTLVAESRHLSITEVDNIAGGRVWSGEKALALNLVDKLGTLSEAIEAAAKLAELTTWDVNHITRDKSASEIFLENLIGSDIGASIAATVLQPSASLQQLNQTLTPLLTPLKELQLLQKPTGIYAECVSCNFNL